MFVDAIRLWKSMSRVNGDGRSGEPGVRDTVPMPAVRVPMPPAEKRQDTRVPSVPTRLRATLKALIASFGRFIGQRRMQKHIRPHRRLPWKRHLRRWAWRLAAVMCAMVGLGLLSFSGRTSPTSIGVQTHRVQLCDPYTPFHAGDHSRTNPTALGSKYRPGNFDESEGQAPKRLREALAHSVNVAAVWTLDKVGPSNVVTWAKSLGISSKLGADLSLALGSLSPARRERGAARTGLAETVDRELKRWTKQ